ncbi:P-loop containing nucleoside triphosphate hydrolase protein [Dacryopinax primogenitus]|uniref:p-loop containing nucleoside triphosphate hydrolase protein n=1 Tax=Dacryopinax primogenitus (strain DJM 731) TaxID=1858805 RepID=M5FS19_DACPD|nr:P-loop containing nucleoside triphosphate hydrolase protein [Dacryopinax primogenitus]EJT98573.1 P-loop containing nucleoside triphosphate hydrolase protein [Dacryopinax primogenitus]
MRQSLFTDPWGALERALSSFGTVAPYIAELDGDKAPNIREHLRLLPAYVAAASLLVLLLTALAHVPTIKTRLEKWWAYSTVYEPKLASDVGRPTTFRAWVEEHVHARGGPVIYTFMLLRLVGCAALMGLTIAAVVLVGRPEDGDSRLRMSYDGWAEIGLGVAYTYATILSILAITLGPVSRKACRTHTTLLLFVVFCVFGWRNLLPLTTFTGVPADGDISWLLWTRGSLLTLVGVLLPLLTPRLYHPVDPLNPALNVNQEQTAPPLLFAFWVFLDPVIFKAYSQPKLPYEQLPPLADYDWATHLAARSFDRLEPLRRRARGLKDRYLFWGMMEVWRWDYVRMATLMSIRVFAGFLGPIGVNRLLTYLEDPEYVTDVRPWVWVSLLAIDPIIGSLCLHMYIFITTRMVVQCESILTQLIFQHSLKIRLKDDAPPSSPSAAASGTRTPDPQIIEQVESVDGDGTRVGTENFTTAESETAVGTEQTESTAGGSPPPKDKRKKKGTQAQAEQTKDEDKEKSSHLVGKINNLIGTDLGNLVEGRDFLFVILQAPLQLLIAIWFLYAILGWAAVIGMAVMIACIPLPSKVAQWVQVIQTERMKKTDSRVQAITETMNVLRMVKMFGWESRVKEQIAEKRDEELKYVKQRQIMHLANLNLNFGIPLVTMIITFAFYSLVMRQPLTASRVFSSMVVFDSMRTQLHICFWEIPVIIAARVSLDRVNEFMHKASSQTELLDRYTPSNVAALAITAGPSDAEVVGFHNATFTWNDVKQGTPTPGRRNFRLHLEDLIFKPNTVNLIVGPTGSGKTSILMALLGEMHFQPSGPDSWFNLPRDKRVAYAAQESWLQNETIRENIVFGEPFDEDRYNKVIQQCALERDLTLFDAGDQTEVGEKGLTLSGGQKARVTLARAIYSHAQLLLLDDVLSALDVHTSKWIIDKCFKGDLVKGRTILLVTHNVAIAAPIAGNIISLDSNGNVISQGSIAQALSHDAHLREEMKEGNQALEKAAEEEAIEGPPKETKKADGKLVLAEEMAEGHLSWKALGMFLSAFGSRGFWVLVLLGFFIVEVAQTISTWWLGVWAAAYEHNENTVDVPYYIGVYSAIVVAFMIIYGFTYLGFTFGAIRAARMIHHQLRDTVLGSTLRWLDSTPVGRIISRFTQDMRQIDGPLPGMFGDLIELTWALVAKFGAVIYFSPIFAIPGIAVAALGGWLGQVYIAAQLSVKREMSNRRSPLYNHFAAAVAGLISIRAYGAEDSFQAEIVRRIDIYSRPARTFYNLNRWISVRIDVLGGLFAAGLASYLVYKQAYVGASNIGFSLNMAVGLAGMILWWVRVLNEFEIAGNSLERILDYVVIEQEPVPTEKGKPPAYWPASGSIRAENLCARYSKDGPIVLDNLNFEIKSGERVGIVGRTGSGKSSLTLSLLRMIPTTGVIYYDGMPTNDINLDALRSNLTIIPQDPTLMSGTLRSNLDPFSQHDDHILNDALRAAGLFRLQTEGSEDAITLDSAVTSGGSNFSVGQRQIIALARAIVRGAKVLILDEATASVDAETDNAIQTSIRSELEHATLITIAHRLQTIADYDKIMVLDAGKLVEFDSPLRLLEKDGGFFRGLVEESGDKEKLWQMARTAALKA